MQTHAPEHPVMQALVANDRDRFVAAELAGRSGAGMPPYGRLASLIVSGPDPAAVDNVCAAIARAAPQQDGVTVLGPSVAPMALLRGRHRRRFLLKTGRDTAVQPLLHAWLGANWPAGFSALANRRRSLFIPVTERAEKAGNTRVLAILRAGKGAW